jgi:hypothetical protein
MSTAAPTSSPETVGRMTGCTAVLNAGSSSIKFALYEAARDGPLLFRGQVENIGLAAHLAVADPSGAVVAERRWGKGELDHHGATAKIPKLGRELLAAVPCSPSAIASSTAALNSPRRSASMLPSWPRSKSSCRWP